MSTGQFLAGANGGGSSGYGGGYGGGYSPTGGATDTTNYLPGWYEDYTQRINAAALGQASQGYTPYQGQRLASTSDPTMQARARIQNRFDSPIFQGALSQAQGDFTQGGAPMTADAIQGYMNPYTSNVADAVTRRMTQNFTDKVLPGIGINYAGAGQSGSERELLSNRLAANDFEQNLGDTLGGVMNTGYQGALSQFNADQNRSLTAGGALTGLASTQFGLDTAQTGQMAGVGSDIENRDQQGLNLGYTDFQNQRDWNKQQIDWLGNTLKGEQVPTSSASFNSPTTMPSGTLQMLGAAGSMAGQIGQGFTGPAQTGNGGYATMPAQMPGTQVGPVQPPPQMWRGGRVRRKRYAMGGLAFPDIVAPSLSSGALSACGG